MKPLALVTALSLAAASLARADILPARDTADVGNKGDWSIGVFDPLRVGLADGVEIKGPSLLFLVDPNLTVRVAHFEAFGFRFAGEYGVSCPAVLLHVLQGFVTPSYSDGGGQVGWSVVPSVGLVATHGERTERTLTFNADIAAAIPFTRDTTTAPSGVAPYDDLLSPIYGRVRFRLGATYDASLFEWLRVRGSLGMSVHGTSDDDPSPVAFNATLGFDLAVGKKSRFTLGVTWWNADTRAIDMTTHEHKRSNDFFPAVDFIWAG